MMDHTEAERLHLLRDQKLIDEYFRLVIKRDLNLDLDVSNEYVIVHNIVSKKLIIARTFSDITLENPELYFLLSSLIQDVNTHSLSKSRIITVLENK